MDRKTIKAFKEYLNRQYPGTGHGTGAYKGQCVSKTRPYGDYLYAQDRNMFMFDLEQALSGKTDQYPGFKV